MQLQTIVLALAALAAASPAPDQRRTANLIGRSSDLCGPLDTPMCCETDILGVADLNCASIDSSIKSTSEFESTCADKGKSAECCVTSLLGDTGLLCSSP
ncbi:fungal hydrophobin-domain-containing protein [Delphinella strobiligena]|nr:fungal hydrophobin-domain-containing protein [Delphinella strobiligena]